jgi:hypothetical protein
MKKEVERKAISPRNKGYTQNASLAGADVILTTSEYDDGQLGGIQIRMPKSEADWAGLLSCFSNSVSLGLQFGVPLESYVEQNLFLRFNPSGEVIGNDSISHATSIVDYVFRELAITYLGRSELAQTSVEGPRNRGDSSIEIDGSMSDVSLHVAVSVDAINSIVDDLIHHMPNEFDKNGIYLNQIEKLKEISNRLSKIALQLKEPNSKLKDIRPIDIQLFKVSVKNWLENNSDLIDSSKRLSLASIFLGIFSAFGVNMTIATPAILAIFGGAKMIEILKNTAKMGTLD